MKQKTLFLGFLCAASMAVQAQEKFTLTGKLSGFKEPVMIHLKYQTAQGWQDDSMLVKNGAFTYKGALQEPLVASLFIYVPPPAHDYLSFVIEKGKITISGDSLKTATVKGGKIQADYVSLQTQVRPLGEQRSAFYKTWNQYSKEKNLTAMDEVHTQQLNAIEAAIRKIEDGYIGAHPDNYVSLFTLQQRAWNIDPDFEPLFNGLSGRLRNTEAAKKIAGFIALAKKTAIGQPAIDFTQNNTEGMPVSLSSLKGKYVLVDFWASWCGPCRKENPNVVKAYNKFKDRNFEIIAVSLDKAKEPWLKAIKEDGLSWIHVSDLKYWNNAVAQEYGIQSIPQNLLLDPNGIIIAKKLRGEALEKKLAEVIK